ncbi:MAG: gluconate 2-dehydrogenase subunit 3 family protein [Pararhodobacter sp.]
MTPKFLETNRRRFLGGTASVAVLSSLPLRAEPQEQQNTLDQYEREFLNPAEWAFVMAATARLIPSDGDGPGAIEARVPVFIDRQLAGDFGAAVDLYMEGPFDAGADPYLGIQSPLTPSQIYREGIAAFDAWCAQNHGAGFADLDAGTQDAALTALSDDEVGLPDELREFWNILLQNTKEGYFADPQYGGNAGMQSWVYIGFPGARANFLEWVGRDEPYRLGPVNIAGERA